MGKEDEAEHEYILLHALPCEKEKQSCGALPCLVLSLGSAHDTWAVPPFLCVTQATWLEKEAAQ